MLQLEIFKMGNVCLAPVTVDQNAHQVKVQPETMVMKSMVLPVMTDNNRYKEKMIEPKVKNMKRQLAL